MSARFTLIVLLLVAVAIGSSLAGSGSVTAQSTEQTRGHRPESQMQHMMKMHEQMSAQMKADDAKLDALVKEMNSATGETRTTAIAAVVNELVRQHKSVHEHMGQMHEHMMAGRGMMMK